MNQPLDGIRIVDLTQIASGPYATSMLGDFRSEEHTSELQSP